ncbi:hypothetical protein [Oscillatoria sp. HE19RPO]|uniref:hypothetical protein n=1 Tax=Oscillatoria sp. HE19RPO TaxID=2954806 RepID=UPI0020C220A0|nr:hypothetical protein [Oscillatoria sp. HE19RPO]
MRGFGEGNQPDISNTIVDSFDDLRDLLSSFFSSARDILVPNGQPLGQSGSNPRIREVQGDVDTALDLLGKVIEEEGGTFTDVTPAGYPGIMIQLPNGERYAVRDKMNNSPNTNANMDVNAPISAPEIKKIKFNP